MFRRWFGSRRAKEADGTAQLGGQGLQEAAHVEVAFERIGGPPELEWMFIDVPESDVQRGLEGWTWIDLSELTAIAVSAFGDVFFRAADHSIHMLDTIEGRVREVAKDLPAFMAVLQETDARDELLLGGLVNAARESGLSLEAGECYDFRLPPIVGGEMSLKALHKLSFLIKLHLSGQLHEQVKDLRPGTPISGFTLSEQT